MRVAIIGAWWLITGAMLSIAQEPLSTARQVLLGAGIALALVGMFIFLLCADSLSELDEVCEEQKLRNT